MTAIEKSVVTAAVETEDLENKVKAAVSKEAGETLECVCSKSNYTSTVSESAGYCMEGFLFVWE